VIIKYWYKWLISLFGFRFYVSFGGGSKAPPPPDPTKVANAQFALNRNTSAFEARQNRYAQNNPFGSISWQNKGTAKNPRWIQTTRLSPSQQAIYGNQQALQRGASGAALRMLPGVTNSLMTKGYDAQGDLSGIQNKMRALNPDSAMRGRVESALFQRLNPSLRQDEEALRTRLANQGLQYGTEAYNNAMRDNSQRINDARLAVIGQGGQEMERQFNMGLQGLQSQAGLASDRQGLSAQARNQKLAELSAMIQSGGSVNLPTYGGATNVGGVGAPDLTALTGQKYQGQVANANAQTASNNAAMQSAATLAASLLGSKLGGK